MNATIASTASAFPVSAEPLMGLARLMTLAFTEVDLAPIGARLLDRAAASPDDAEALMDLSTLLQLRGDKQIGLAAQAQALRLRQLYRQPAHVPARIRLLAIMAPGDLMANTPLDFLVQHTDVALEMLYVLPGQALPATLPDHDLVFIAVCENDNNRALLEQLDGHTWPKPVCNRPGRIGRTSRELAHELLASAPRIVMPASARINRTLLEDIAHCRAELRGHLADGAFPLIIRPVDSHAGHGLEKIDTPEDLAAYLAKMADSEFHLSRFVDYRSADGQYRKYRVVLIDGRPYAGHMGISAHWMIHYLNAGMTECPQKRREEELFMEGFDRDFAIRHGEALAAIVKRIGLDYLVMDCGETADGRLLVFEIDPGAVVHDMDPVALFPYKHAKMQKVFAAFYDMLLCAKASEANLCAPRS